MSWKSVAKWAAIAGATYLGASALSNAVFDTNYKTIGNMDGDGWLGGDTAKNIGSALTAATTAASSGSAASAGNQSLLGKIGGGVLDFAKSAGGGALLAGALQGLSAGKAAEEQINEQRRYKRAFTPEEMAQMGSGNPLPNGAPGSAAAGSYATGGYLDRARRVSDFMSGRREPAVRAPLTPDQLAGYARGG
jgi:hypothetical protein